MEELKQKKKRSVFDTVLTVILSAVIVVCVVSIAVILGKYKKADNVYDDMRDKFIKPADTVDINAGTDENGESAAAAETPFSVDFGALLDYNSDIVGWIYCEDTPISYPVAQSADNDYYLRRSLDGEYLVTGTIFADFRCGAVGENDNYIIYGHHMRNGTIFGSLEKYKKQSYYDEHPTLTYFTPDKTFLIEVFAGYVTDTESAFYNTDFEDGARADAIEYAKGRSGFVSDVEVGDADSIVTLSTCSYDFEDARFILLGKISDVSETK